MLTCPVTIAFKELRVGNPGRLNIVFTGRNGYSAERCLRTPSVSRKPAVALVSNHRPEWLFAGVNVTVPLAARLTQVPPLIHTTSAAPVAPEI